MEPALTEFAVSETIRLIREAGKLSWPPDINEEVEVKIMTERLTPSYGHWLARNPAVEDLSQLSREVVQELKVIGALGSTTDALELKLPWYRQVLQVAIEAAGAERLTFAGELLRAVEAKRLALWREYRDKVNWELFDRGTETYTHDALEELVTASRAAGLVESARRGKESKAFANAAFQAQLGHAADQRAFAPFSTLCQDLVKPFRGSVFFWPRQTGPRGDLVDDEMGRVLQVPGWSNIFTQPIINRIEMLSTGVRTDIGVKVFGPDLASVERVGKQVEAVLKPLSGARDVIAAPFMGKGYVQIDIDREAPPVMESRSTISKMKSKWRSPDGP